MARFGEWITSLKKRRSRWNSDVQTVAMALIEEVFEELGTPFESFEPDTITKIENQLTLNHIKVLHYLMDLYSRPQESFGGWTIS